LRGHIEFISEIELSKCVEAVCKIWKLLKLFFLRYQPLSESCFGKIHWGYVQVMYEEGFQYLRNY
jgi:hypothetical protein